MRPRTSHGQHTLAGEFFTSAEIFRQEMERVFLGSWLCAGHVSELAEPGDYLTFEIDAESVLVVRDGDGAIQAYHNVCRHRGSRLCVDAAGNVGRAIRCPYHAWSYGLDGALVAAPNMDEVTGFDRSKHALRRPGLALWNGFVFLNLAQRPVPFEQAMQGLVGRFNRWAIAVLRSAHRQVYEVEANWKLFFHNYNECYHCPTVHPHLNRLTPYRDTENDLDEGPVLGGPMLLSRGAGGSMTTDGGRCAPALADLDEGDLARVYYYTVFPSMFLSLHPDYVLVHRAQALGPTRTRITCDWLFHPEAMAAPGFDPGGAIEFWDLTNRQDWELCANTQRGVASRAYVPGPYSELESQLAAFDREYLRAMGGRSGVSAPASVRR